MDTQVESCIEDATKGYFTFKWHRSVVTVGVWSMNVVALGVANFWLD